MKKIYHLSTCSTNIKILKEVKPPKDIELIDIKVKNISAKDLDYAAKKIGSYEALFSRKAIKYRELGLANVNLSDEQIRKLILEEYTFLKRPVAIIGKHIFAGNTKETIENLKASLQY